MGHCLKDTPHTHTHTRTHTHAHTHTPHTHTHTPAPTHLPSLQGSCEGTLILQFNPLSGEDLEQSTCEPFSLRQAMLLPFEDNQHRKVLLLATVDGRFLTYPRTEEALKLVSSSAESVFVYFVSMEKGTVEGLQLKRAGGKTAELGAEQVWMINFTAASQKIVAAVSRSADGKECMCRYAVYMYVYGVKHHTHNTHAHTHSELPSSPPHDTETVNAQAKVSGDHTVLFKYLNPHLIAVATESNIPGKGKIGTQLVATINTCQYTCH